MSKREEQRLAALIKKNAAKASGAGSRQDKAAKYDDTLSKKTPEQDDETKRFFKEMKRREF
jgi:ATP-dependent DNA ligase